MEQMGEKRFALIRQIAKAVRDPATTQGQWGKWLGSDDVAVLVTLLGCDEISPLHVRGIARRRFHSRLDGARGTVELALSRCPTTPSDVLDDLDVTDAAVSLGLANNPNTSVAKLRTITNLPVRTRPADKLRGADERDQNTEVRQIAVARLERILGTPAEG